MKKRFQMREAKRVVAVLLSLALVLAMFVALPGVKAWATLWDESTHHISNSADANPVALVYAPGDVLMGNTGTIPSGSKVYVGAGTGVDVSSIEAFISASTTDGDGNTMYTLSSPVKFTVNGLAVGFELGSDNAAAGASAAGGDAEGNGVVAGPTAAQIAWAQFHDHAHNGNTGGFVWEQTVATTEYSDGEVIYRCPECGYIERTTGGDAYDFFNDSFIRQVRVGKPGQTITIEAGQWVSFNKALIDALRNNREITTNIIYKSNGVLSTLTIPRGTDFSNVPEDKYTGIDYLAYCLGIVPVPKFG